MSSRKNNGQFKAGQSGNPEGRPPKPMPHYTLDASEKEFLDIDNTVVEITQRGQRKKVRTGKAIQLQLANLAMKGDRESILQWQKIGQKIYERFEARRRALYEAYLDAKKTAQARPDDVTDVYLGAIAQMRGHLIRDYQMHWLQNEEL